MARARAPDDGRRRRRPATTPEAREIQVSAMAYDLAEEQIRQGTASSQVITHFLKMGSTRERLEQQRIEHENELLQVKRQAIESQQRIEELYLDAIAAMKSYAGHGGQEVEDDEQNQAV